MNQAAHGKAIGVTPQTVIAIEQGLYSPSLESAFRLERLFDVGIEDVFGWGRDDSDDSDAIGYDLENDVHVGDADVWHARPP